MTNKTVPLEEKLKLVHRFYTEFWGTEVIKDTRPEPPTVAQMLNKIKNSTFPALELLEVEDHWMRARVYYGVYGGETELLDITGDPNPEEEARKFAEMLDFEARLDKIMEDGDWDNPVLLEYEKRTGIRFVRFPKLIEHKYEGLVRDFDEDSLIISDGDAEIAFDVNPKLDRFDLNRPIKVFTNKFIRPDGSETTEKVCRIEQASPTENKV